MIPWQKLPKDLQRALLAIVVLSSEAAAVSSCRPMVCDPAPPPRTSPTPTPGFTPMICDPAPPPRMTPMLTITPTPTVTPSPTFVPMICDPAPPPTAMQPPVMTPMICDPAPPPDLTPRPEPTAAVALPGFAVRTVQIMPDRAPEGIEVRGTVTDHQGKPVRRVKITLAAPGIEITSRTSSDGIYALNFSEPGHYLLFVGEDQGHSVPLDLKLHDLAFVDWSALGPRSQAPLPLAEIRTVRIAPIAAGATPAPTLDFAAASPWSGAAYAWTVSGGTLTTAGPRATWRPLVEPGRYLLQVVADWDYAGLAVDAVVLTVGADGRVTVS